MTWRFMAAVTLVCLTWLATVWVREYYEYGPGGDCPDSHRGVGT